VLKHRKGKVVTETASSGCHMHFMERTGWARTQRL
jgi:hypothetical protein